MGKLLGQMLTVLIFVGGSAAAIGGFATQQPKYIGIGMAKIYFSTTMGRKFFD
ncbi:hypothetical protein [Anabaena sp. CCY 9402-a]|uniref:hypothetical protein n=1 Tax=Anabaena sp. CCY 9402-a TaxID=3103867 RepID=UPI0039C740EA